MDGTDHRVEADEDSSALSDKFLRRRELTFLTGCGEG